MTPESDVTPPRTDILDSLWRIGSAPAATALLLLLIGLLLVLAVTFPQLPAGLDAASAERWLAAAAQSYRGAGPLLRALGLFDVLGGLALRILLAALAFNLLLWLAIQVQHAIGAYRQKGSGPALPPTEPTRRINLPGALAERWPSVEATVRRRYPVVAIKEDPGAVQLYAQRGRFGAIGQVMVCLGPLLLLSGVLINSAVGWRTGDLAIAPRRSIVIPRAGAIDVRLNSIGGSGRATASFLTLTRLDGRMLSAQVTAARPVRWGNLWLLQRSTGPALVVSARDQEGRPLVIQSLESADEVREEVSMLFRQTQTEQGVAVPARRNLTFRAVSYDALPEQGIVGPVFLVEAYRSDDVTPIASQLVENEAQISVDDATYTFRRDRYAVVEVLYLPGLPLMLLGGLVAVVGAIIAWSWNYSQAWIEAADRGDTTALTLSAAAWRQRGVELDRLAGDLEVT